MPPKKEERKPLLPIFDIADTPFYQYQSYDQETIDKVNQFLIYFKPELMQLVKNSIYDNMQVVSQAIGLPLHPSFVRVVQQVDIDDFDENRKFKNPDEYENEQPPQIVSINSYKVDVLTLKLLEFCCNPSAVQTLKFCNNNLEAEQYQMISQIISNAECKIKKLYIDWQQPSPELFKSIQQLEHLYLRSCHIDTTLIEVLTQNFRNLKCLDLYDNQLTRESLDIIGIVLRENTSLEQLGLAKNQIKSLDDLLEIMRNVGKFQMTQEEYEDYRNKEKERDAIIERNKKVKKKGTEEPVPTLEPIQQFDNNWYVMRNQKLILLNLSLNLIDDQSFQAIEKLLLQTNEAFQLVLTNNKFEDTKNVQKIKKRFNKKLIV